MTLLQEESKISVTYVGKSSWEVLFGDMNDLLKHGRNVLFAGRSQGDCPCVGLSDWTLYENLQHNNLGGKGPMLTDPLELRYSKVFETRWDQQPVDLVIKVAEGSTYTPMNTANNVLNPVTPVGSNQMGQINIGPGTVSTFDFIFVNSGTDTPIPLSNLLFSVYDLDQIYDPAKPKKHKGLRDHEYAVFPDVVTNWTLTLRCCRVDRITAPSDLPRPSSAMVLTTQRIHSI